MHFLEHCLTETTEETDKEWPDFRKALEYQFEVLLACAAKKKDVFLISRLLEMRPDGYICFDVGVAAVERDDPTLLRTYLESGSPLLNENYFGRFESLALRAATLGSLRCLKVIADAGHSFQERASDASTALICATKSMRFRAVNFLLSLGVEVDAADNTGNTALMWAVTKGSCLIAEILLKAGASPNATNIGNSLRSQLLGVSKSPVSPDCI